MIIIILSVILLQVLNHVGFGRDYWFIDPTKSGDDTKRRVIYTIVTLALLISLTGNFWFIALAPLAWLVGVLANDVPLNGIQGFGTHFKAALDDGNQIIANILKVFWPDDKHDLTSVWQTKLRSMVYDMLSNVLFVPFIALSAVSSGNLWNLLWCLATPITGIWYVVGGLINVKYGTKIAEGMTGLTFMTLCVLASIR